MNIIQTVMEFIIKIINKIKSAIKLVFNFIFAPKINVDGLPIVDCLAVYKSVDAAYARETNMQLVDNTYKLPTLDIINKIYKNYWLPHKDEYNLSYCSEFDCDNFASSFMAVVSELKLGICIGMAHYSYYKVQADGNKYWYGHAVGCTILDNKQFLLIEPQLDSANTYELPKDADLNFVYLQGIS